MNTVKISACLALASLLAACQTLPGKGHYEPHDARMVGTWMVLEPEFDDGSAFLPGGEKTYFPDGTACGYILSVNENGAPELEVFRSRWEIRDGQLISTVVTTDAEYLRPGEPIVDDIISLDAHVLRLHSVPGPAGFTYARYKSPVDQGDRLCKLADAVMGSRRD